MWQANKECDLCGREYEPISDEDVCGYCARIALLEADALEAEGESEEED